MSRKFKEKVEAVLSFLVVGLGQVYARGMCQERWEKGVVFRLQGSMLSIIFVAWLISLALVVVVVGAVLAPVIYIWNIIDAYNTAKV